MSTIVDAADAARANWTALFDWQVDEASSTPLYQQVASVIRDKILDGVIPIGSRLPSTRVLTSRLNISRTTVITAYSQLLADGYVVCRVGSGTYVAENAFEIGRHHGDVNGDVRGSEENARRTLDERLSVRGRRYLAMNGDNLVLENVPFNTGMVRMDSRAAAQWQHIARRMLAVEPSRQGYYHPQGSLELREAIVRYLSIARGVKCNADQVIAVAGSQQAIDLTIKVLLDPGDPVWVEEPGYAPTRLALEVAGTVVHPIGVDQQGMRVEAGILRAPDARAAFVTPSHQYPLGVQLSLERRKLLLDWASSSKGWIIEDDYDSEFRYDNSSLPPLKALDEHDCVIYIGSFSKVLLPAMRCGYMVVPPGLVPAFNAARFLTDRHSPVFLERVLTEFIARGHFVDNIGRMRTEYQRSRDYLVALLKNDLGHVLDVEAPHRGLHLIAYLRNQLSDVVVAREAHKAGVVVRPISLLYSGSNPRSGLMFGFSGMSDTGMRTSVNRLVAVFERLGYPSR